MTIDLSCATRWITLGFERENLARPQEFDFSAWAEEYGSGVPQLLFQRPGEDTPYPVLLDVSGTTATWTPSATDTAITGEGKAQLSYVVGETVVKNAIFAVLISPSLGASGDPPEGFETWLEELTELAADAQAAAISAGNAETAAETAQGLAEAAEGRAAGYANDAAGSAGTAGDAATAATNAKTAAQTAQGKAEDAQAAAVSAKNAAVAAKTAIEDMSATASVADNVPGTPSVAVTKSTISGHENLDFVFSHIKGAKGDAGSQGVQGPTGPQGPRGYDGSDGQNGVSPTVTVTDISGGHRVTITDADHPAGQSFDVMDGDVGNIDAGDVAYDDQEEYPLDTVGAEISTVKSAIDSTESNLVWRLGTPTEIVAEQSVSFSADSDTGLYKHSGNLTGINWSTEFSNNSNGNIYAVTWDGTTYYLVMWSLAEPTANGYRVGIYLGNTGLLSFRDPYAADAPFVFRTRSATAIYTSSTAESHTISISRIPVIFGKIHKPVKSLVGQGTGAYSVTIAEEACDADAYGIAIGYAARAGQMAFSSGLYSAADGAAATAIGYFARAYGLASTAIGFGVNASGEGQIVLGAYNVIDSSGDYALIFGDGTGDNARHNLLTVAPDGTIVSGGKRIAFVDESPVTVSGTTPTIAAVAGNRYVCGEVATLTVTVPASGIIDVVFTSGSTPTVLTVTPPTGMTMMWANGFDPTALESNTVYEINIMDGVYGVVGTWT